MFILYLLRGTFITCILAVPSRVSLLPFPFILLSRALILPGTFLLHSFIFDFNRLDPSVYSGITNWPTIMQDKNPEGWGVLPIVAYTRRVGILLVKVYMKEGLNGA